MQITNNSRHEISVILTPTYSNIIPNNPTSKIPSNSTKSYPVNTGTMNLFIWSENQLVWSGVVPTLIKKPLIYSGNVMYSGVVILPFQVSTTKRGWKLWIIILLIVIGLMLAAKYYLEL